ncbi:hypothetical protein EPI10_018729 [Gossypium australe]|uniref:Uncharacterized protein n=1 Tax=Gossypium australe TaxID=47621 RepID=A0A5B6UGR8_9ROSI|nr:hypothetical protein EPI10_018729 [Gossypium australe]
MGDALFELEQNLRSRKEQLTRQEENIFQRCKSSALNHFTAGVIAGGGLVWAGIYVLRIFFATWKLNRLLRVNLSGVHSLLCAGAAVILGFWKFGNSLDSSVDHILALDGTRMQSELANMYVIMYYSLFFEYVCNLHSEMLETYKIWVYISLSELRVDLSSSFSLGEEDFLFWVLDGLISTSMSGYASDTGVRYGYFKTIEELQQYRLRNCIR